MRIALRVVSITAAVGLVTALLTVPMGASAAKRTSVRLAGDSSRPDDPPIGVALQTLSADPRAAIWIDGLPVRDTYNRDGIFVDVLKRTTRKEVEPGTVPRDAPGIAHLMRIAEHWQKQDPADGYLMIVSGPIGVHRDDVNALDKLVQFVGGTKLTTAERSRLIGGAPWSVIGIPGGPPDSAWIRIGVNNGSPGSGDITGYLQYSLATSRYDYVSPDYPTFDTQDGGPQPGRNVIRVGNAKYEIRLPAGASAGFQILALNPQSLQMVENVAISTNQPEDLAQQQNGLSRALKHVEYEIQPAPLVFVQSIGNPKAERWRWADAADAINAMGGIREVFNAVDGRRHYALVGGSGHRARTIELSDGSGDDRLVGGLARGHDLRFVPTAAGPPDGVNTELISMAYQAPRPFPALSTAVQKAAETYLGDQSGICGRNAPVCEVRPRYYSLTLDQIKEAKGNISGVTWPGPGPEKRYGTDSSVFDAVKNQLHMELQAVVNVGNYFAGLQNVFGKIGQKGRVDLDAIGNEIFTDLKPPGDSRTSGKSWEYASKLISLTGSLPPPAGNVGKGYASFFALMGFLSRQDGGSLLADTINSKAKELAADFQKRMFATEARLTDFENLFESDYGKLIDMDSRLRTTGWELTKEGVITTLSNISGAARRWFAEQLVPHGYIAIRGTPPPVGPGDANGLSCKAHNIDKDGEFVDQLHPWRREPANAQIRAVGAWETNGRPILPTYFLSKALSGYWPRSDLAPAQAVADLLFGRARAQDSGPLGLDKLEFLSTRVFAKVHRANDAAWFCDL